MNEYGSPDDGLITISIRSYTSATLSMGGKTLIIALARSIALPLTNSTVTAPFVLDLPSPKSYVPQFIEY